MNLHHKIIAAAPKKPRVNRQFTDNVMAAITKKRAHGRLVTLLGARPAFAALAGAVTLAVIAGTAYAISYVWPLITVNVSKPIDTTSGRKSVQVFSNECPEISGKKYELKKVAPFGSEKIADVVKAECNLEALRAWSDREYPDYSFSSPEHRKAPNMTPGAEVTTKMINYPRAYKVASISATGMVLEQIDQWNPSNPSIAFSPDVKFIVDHQYKTWQGIKAGDAVATISLWTGVSRNNDDCTAQHCGNTQVSLKEELKAVAKLDQPFEDYNKFGSLSELMKCQDNENDYCHTGNTASIDIFDNYRYKNESPYDENERTGMLEGVIQSHNAASTVVKTTSGRIVTIKTTSDFLENFNATRSVDYNGTTAGTGDTIAFDYIHRNGEKNVTVIPEGNLARVSLLIEINSKAELTPTAVPKKY